MRNKKSVNINNSNNNHNKTVNYNSSNLNNINNLGEIFPKQSHLHISNHLLSNSFYSGNRISPSSSSTPKNMSS